MPNQMQSPTFPSVPVPDGTTGGMLNTLLALKTCVDMLTGNAQVAMGGAQADRQSPHVFVQNTAPQALDAGDLWLCTGTSMSFNIWNGTKWLVIATLPA